MRRPADRGRAAAALDRCRPRRPVAAAVARPAQHLLRVSPGRRHLVDASGAPFLYLADTAWRLFGAPSSDRREFAQDLVLGPNAPGEGFVRAALARDRSFAFVYVPRGETVAVHQGRLGALDVTSWWFDPRYGRAYKWHRGVGTGIQFFTPPTSGRGCDWVLVIDDTSRRFPPPGER